MFRWVRKFSLANALTASAKQVRCNARNVGRFISAGRVVVPQEIDCQRIETHLAGLLAQGLSAKTVRNHHASLSGFCGFLVSRKILTENPCAGMRLPRSDKCVPLYLDDAECDQALAIARENNIHCEVCLALNTGLRMSELRRLEWSHVNLEGRRLLVCKTKSHKPRTAWLNVKAVDALRQQHRVTGSYTYVFPGWSGGHFGRKLVNRPRGQDWWARTALVPLQEAISKFSQLPKGTTGRGWHLLRHTFASRAVQNGVSIFKVSSWLGHASVSTTQVYAHLSPDFDEEIEKI